MKISKAIILVGISCFFSCKDDNRILRFGDAMANIHDSAWAYTIRETSGWIPDTVHTGLKFKPHGNYQNIKNEIERFKSELSARSSGCDSFYLHCGKELEKFILDSIIPFWYGTVWDFNGHTDIPGEGQIACGYFVSTVLKHSGFNLNRFKLAQQAASDAECTLLGGKKPEVCPTSSPEIESCFKNKYKAGLYVAGLDNHVGFLLFRKSKLVFIHSSYIFPGYVVAEPIENSPAFLSSAYVWIAPITTNPELMRKWLLSERIN